MENLKHSSYIKNIETEYLNKMQKIRILKVKKATKYQKIFLIELKDKELKIK